MSGGPDDARMWDLASDGGRFLLRTTGTQTEDAAFDEGLIFVENWFEELKERVPLD